MAMEVKTLVSLNDTILESAKEICHDATVSVFEGPPAKSIYVVVLTDTTKERSKRDRAAKIARFNSEIEMLFHFDHPGYRLHLQVLSD